MEIFAPITKVDATQRLVYGVMAEEPPDKSGEIFDPLTGVALEKAQTRSPRFVTRGPQPCNVNDPWL